MQDLSSNLTIDLTADQILALEQAAKRRGLGSASELMQLIIEEKLQHERRQLRERADHLVLQGIPPDPSIPADVLQEAVSAYQEENQRRAEQAADGDSCPVEVLEVEMDRILEEISQKKSKE